MNRKETKYRYRHIARIVLEASTPIAVGSGMSDMQTDSPVIRDVNGLPYIPATSLAGVIRHSLELKDDDSNIFGYHDRKGGRGSRAVFTDAVMVGEKGEVLDGIQNIDWDSPFYSHYQELCVRQHVRIGHTGVAEDAGKFDNEVVFQGTRFVFELEVVSDKDQEADFENVLSRIHQTSFRVGVGTRRGYGQLTAVRCDCAFLDLSQEADLQKYQEKSSNLNEDKAWSKFQPRENPGSVSQDWVQYQLDLRPRDFFLIGSGMGDDDADSVPVVEAVVTWDGDKPKFEERQVLIPASSVKGALSHRTAYHYNKRKGHYADEIDKVSDYVGVRNAAVRKLFGCAAGENEEAAGDKAPVNAPRRGNVLLGDVFLPVQDTKVFYHNKIDYFTGGTINGALFQEKSVYGKGCSFKMEILVHRDALEEDDVREAFEQSLRDLCAGLLPLGGATGRGNGIFEGKLYKNGEVIYGKENR